MYPPASPHLWWARRYRPATILTTGSVEGSGLGDAGIAQTRLLGFLRHR
jgi:hypothetical protein